MGWFIIGTLYGLKDRQAELRASMQRSMDRVAEIVEAEAPPSDEDAAEDAAGRIAR
jgi:hypothetical protein